jgi:hypothetical protein
VAAERVQGELGSADILDISYQSDIIMIWCRRVRPHVCAACWRACALLTALGWRSCVWSPLRSRRRGPAADQSDHPVVGVPPFPPTL